MTPEFPWKARLSDLLNGRGRQVFAVSVVAAGILAATGGWALWQTAAPAVPELPAMLPQGALLTIESKDFAGLLKQWSDSPEKAAWLKSDNYAGFSRSRLFGRLGDAQNEFAKAAGLPPDMSFLNEVAGRESVFAWYDTGQLEFLYITRLPSGAAEKTRLIGLRGKFSARKVGEQTFYIRSTGKGDAQAEPGQPDAAQPEQEDAQGIGQPRTVAFATHGDWLLLATREDLMVGALTLMASQGKPAAAGATLPLSEEAWFADARTAAAKEPGELRMMLNLEKIVRTPYFRSYWIERNVSEMKQYRAAVADLHMDSGQFREDRVLLPQNPQEVAAAPADLATLTALLPEHAGVYRAVAASSAPDAVASIDEKLLERTIGGFEDARIAPVADLSVQGAGSTSDIETRIDSAPLARPAAGAQLAALRQALESADLNGMMTVSRTDAPKDGIWVPFHSAVVLSAGKDWDSAAMQAALRQALAAHLTASGLGLAWKPMKAREGAYWELSETRPLEMAVRGRVCLLADDPKLMLEMLGHLSSAGRAQGKKASAKPTDLTPATTLIAGFDLPQEQPGLARWSKLVDRTGSAPGGGGNEPSFFAQNMLGLTEVFAPLESERVVETKDAGLTRQTVIYAWRR
jgi:hypothetical protein